MRDRFPSVQVDELAVAKSSRQLLHSEAANLDVQQLSAVEDDAIKCATACKDGSPYTAGKGLAGCMKGCLEKALNPQVIAKAAVKRAIDWHQSELDDLVMMGAMKKVRKELTTSQAQATLSKILTHNPRKSQSHTKYKMHKLKTDVKSEYSTFQSFVGQLTPAKQQHALAEAELARSDLSKLASKFAPHDAAADVEQSSDGAQEAGSTADDNKSDDNQPEQQVEQVEQAFEAKQQEKATKQEQKVQDSEKERVSDEQKQEAIEKQQEKQEQDEEEAHRAEVRHKERFLPKSVRMKLHKKRLLARCSERCSSFAPCMWKCMRADLKK